MLSSKKPPSFKTDGWTPRPKTAHTEPDTFVCAKCGFTMETKQPASWFACPTCAPKSEGLNVIIPAYMRAENEDGNAKQKAYMQTPEAQSKLKSGEWEIRKNSNR